MTQCVETSTLRIAYEDGGPKDGPPVLPYLRGFGPTTFLSAETMRSGEMVAMAQDAIDLADALGLKTFAVVGHDWGARIAYVLAAVFPGRVARMAALSVGWVPGELATPSLEQVRKYWYQWFMATQSGKETVRRDPKAFARIQWETWAPQGWFSDAEFEATAQSFANADWPAITLHSYTVRWGEADKDPRYRELDRRAMSAQQITVPALMSQGGADGVTLAATTDGKDKYFTGGYRRGVIDGVGHFPTREKPDAVSKLLLEFLKS